MNIVGQGLGPGRMGRKKERWAKVAILLAKWKGQGPRGYISHPVSSPLRDLPGMGSKWALLHLPRGSYFCRLKSLWSVPILQDFCGPALYIISVGY